MLSSKLLGGVAALVLDWNAGFCIAVGTYLLSMGWDSNMYLETKCWLVSVS